MKKYYLLLILFFIGLIGSGINPRNYGHWIGESAAPIVGLILLAGTFKNFRYTFFTYSFILFSCYLMFTGAHYTFSRVPLFEWIREYFGQDRNNFDKFGHFVQGILPVIITRELFIRKRLMTNYKWISFISFCVCLATTSTYELIEYIACSIAGKSPVTFLGTQGDFWDSQTDMLSAALGGLVMLLFFRELHDKLLEREFPGTFRNFYQAKSKPDSSPGIIE